MEIKNKSKLPRLTMLLVALLVLVGASYAYFDYLFIGKDNTISTTDVSIKLLESNKEIITLENQLPISDEQGIVQEGTGNVFDFAVETKSSSDMKLGYKLSIEKLQTDTGYTSLTDDQIKIYLTDTDNNKILGPLKISELDNYNLYEDVNIHSKTNNTQVDKYRIRVWIDQDVQVKEWDENTKQQYKFKIGVGSTENEGSYIITYSPNGGEGQMAASVYNQNTTNNLRKNTFTRGGYTFKGWSTTNNGEVEYQDQNTATNLTTSQNEQNRTLYAVWQPNTYTVKYHPNGGLIETTQTIEPDVNYDPVNMGTNNTKWTKEGNVYKSGSLSVEKPTFLFHSITLEAAGTLSFEVAVSQSEDYNGFAYALGSSDLSSTIKQESISATPGITKEDDLVYQKIEVPLEAGSYVLGFGRSKFSKTSEGLDRAYVKNIKLDKGTTDEPIEQSLTVGQNNKLKKNEYKKEHYTFKGWDTNKNENEPKYKDENDLTKLESKVKENEQIDLYAIWEKVKYTVNVVVQNGTVDVATKQVEYNENATFNLTPNMNNLSSLIKCTNNQKGKIENNVLTVSNVDADTTCTITLDTTSSTVLYNDGTLILNELSANRSENVSVHGEVTKEYEPMNNSNSYVFNDASDRPWNQDNIISVEIGSKTSPVSTSHWFEGLRKMENGDFTNLDTSHVTNMSNMFEIWDDFPSNAENYNLIGLEGWDVSKVTDMNSMFSKAGSNATTWTIGDLTNWDTSSVTDMSYMFNHAGYLAITWNIGDISNWNTSKVTTMSNMFCRAGYSATTWSIGDLSKWDTSKVTDMNNIFFGISHSSKTALNLDLTNWDTSSVTDMSRMFYNAGYFATTWNIGDISNWNTSKVTRMSSMFEKAGYFATNFNLDLSNWDISNVAYMDSMFSSAGQNSTTWSVTIPKTTGSLTNTTSKWYGSGESVYATPNSGKSFTLAS